MLSCDEQSGKKNDLSACMGQPSDILFARLYILHDHLIFQYENLVYLGFISFFICHPINSALYDYVHTFQGLSSSQTTRCFSFSQVPSFSTYTSYIKM